tara:strand:+ start:254 stop:991 length:738 start_codon:yes stop_codon:yes gene_type:complete
MPTSSPVSSNDIARLVTEVLRRIHAETESLQAQHSQSVSPKVTTTLSDRVIAAETIIKLAPGTKVAYVDQKAVITPSARDLARDRGIEFIPTKPNTAQPTDSQLFIAQAECTTDVSAVAASIRRAVSTSQQLPSAGLVTTLESFADHAGRDAARCILLTENTAVACVAANRFPAIRAIVGSDITAVADSIARCAANLVILNPRQFSSASMGQIAKELTTRVGNPPEILATAHANTSHGDCSCQNR